MLGDYFRYPNTGGVVHFKSKLLEIGKIFFILNSMYIVYNDYFIWQCTLFSILFLSYYIQRRLKCAMLGAFTVIISVTALKYLFNQNNLFLK